MYARLWYYLFFAGLLAEITAVAAGWTAVQWVTKPLLLVLLMIWFMQSPVQQKGLRYLVLLALLLSWAGDIFLMLEPESPGWFMAGLASFLLAHLVYIAVFLRLRKRQPVPVATNYLLLAVICIYTILLLMVVLPHTGQLQIPVAIYALTIAVMVATAGHAFGTSTPAARFYCLGGAVLFILSDSMLAINRFVHPFPLAGAAVMLSYGLAQFCIAKACLLYLAGQTVPANEGR
jgi:uncharacterized membrane protein YhhN